MISLKKYQKWLNSSVAAEANDLVSEDEVIRVLDTLNDGTLPDYQKDALAQYYLESIKDSGRYKNLNIAEDSSPLNKRFKSWMSGNAYQKMQKQIIQNDHTKYMMCGLTIIMAGTICIYFLYAVISQNFLIAFSADALIASIAFVFLLINMRKKMQIIRRYGKVSDYLLMDIIAFIICILLKFILPPMFDCSVIVLFAAYMIEKKRFEKMMPVVL